MTAALAVKCPRCGAPVGSPCRDRRMSYTERLSIRGTHKERRAALREGATR